MDFWKEKTILITGGGSGIGLALAKHGLNHGANVSTLIRTPSEELSSISSNQLMTFLGDVCEREQVINWIRSTKEQFHAIDMMINNAGCMYYMAMDKPDYKQMQAMVMTNCIGMVNLIDGVMELYDKQHPFHWINMSSDAGKTAFPGLAIYSGTKAFIEFTSKAMRQEMTKYPFKMTNIQPGNVKTNLHKKSTDKSAIKSYASADHGQYLLTEDIISAIDFAISTPFDVAVNEILIQPRVESV